ncbi:MAG TPA: S8 family peptidase [Chloroflexia bacterium]|nr:S8 family peptidase [Chloroflexia bacterium]
MTMAKGLTIKVVSGILSLGVALTLVAPAAGQASGQPSRPDDLGGIGVEARPYKSNVVKSALDHIAGEILVKVDNPSALGISGGKLNPASLDVAQTLDCFALTSAHEVYPGVYKLKASTGANLDIAAASAALQQLPGVTYARANHLYYIEATPNDPLYGAGQQWGVTQIHLEQAWDVTTGGADIVVAVLDTGTAQNHPDLEDKIVPGFDFVNNDADPQDDQGHGTMTAGIVGAATNNGTGIAGTSWGARIMPIKVCTPEGQCAEEAIASGIRWATDHGARIINLSLGGDEDTEIMREATRYAVERNVVVVASAGNEANGKANYPAAYPGVVSVGATGRSDTFTGFSSYGDFVDVSAPGVGVLSTGWDEGELTYTYGNGTSFSGPFVAGVAALVLSSNPSLSAEQVGFVIMDSSEDLGEPGPDIHYGNGRLNAFRAVTLAKEGPRPARTPAPARTPGQGAAPTATAGPKQGPTLQLNLRDVLPGVLITASGSGFGPGELVDLSLLTSDGDLKTLGNAQTDPQGAFKAELALPKNVLTGKAALTANGQKSQIRASVEVNVLSDGGNPASLRPPAFERVSPLNSTATQVYFPEVGHTLRGSFYRFWQQNGGLPIFGYPLSEEFQEVSAIDGKTYTVQYFERNRFELHPEFAGTRNEVLMGLLGVELTKGKNFPAGAPFQSNNSQVFFPETQHGLRGSFYQYWRQNGGLPIFGYPISEELQEISPIDGKTYTVQYFERNRFELHPEFRGTRNEVLLGLLGVEMVRSKGWSQP